MTELTEAQRVHLQSLILHTRSYILASGVGSMHSLWDYVFDAEALLTGQPTILPGTAQEIYSQLILNMKGSTL